MRLLFIRKHPYSTPRPTQTDKLWAQLKLRHYGPTALCWCKLDSADVFTGILHHWRSRSLPILYALFINKHIHILEDNRKWFIDTHRIKTSTISDWIWVVRSCVEQCLAVTCYISSKIICKIVLNSFIIITQVDLTWMMFLKHFCQLLVFESTVGLIFLKKCIIKYI